MTTSPTSPTPPTPPAPSDAAAIIEAMRDLDGAELLNATRGTGDAAPLLVLPKGKSVYSVKKFLDEYLERPERITGTALLDTADGLIAHVQRFKDDRTVLFLSGGRTPTPKLLAVYDYHQNGVPAWGQHRAAFTFPLSDEWRAWTGMHDRPLDQTTLASFIEDHATDLMNPELPAALDAALKLRNINLKIGDVTEVLSVSRGLQVRSEVEIKTSEKLATGETTFMYDESLRGEKGKPLTIPAAFVVAVPVFQGGPKFALPVRLRLRVKGAQVEWRLVLLDTAATLREAVLEASASVAEKTGVPLIEGNPEV